MCGHGTEESIGLSLELCGGYSGCARRRYERLFVAEVERSHERETTLEASTQVCLA